MTNRYPWLAVEPELDEVLDDPVVQAVMARDGVARGEILDLVSAVQERREQDDRAVTEA
jgi:hypothetical protein